MKQIQLSVIILSALLGAVAVPSVIASGSYSARPPQPLANAGGRLKLDREKYGMGQKIFDGRATLIGLGDPEAQMAQLKAVQAKLPADVALTKDLVALAGKLSAGQLAALEYFIDRRFGAKQ